MLDETPLSAVISPRDKFKAGSQDRIDSLFLPPELAEDDSTFPSTSIIAPKEEPAPGPSFDEGEFVSTTTTNALVVQREASGEYNPFDSVPPSSSVKKTESSSAPQDQTEKDDVADEPSFEVPFENTSTTPVNNTTSDMREGYSDNNTDGDVNFVVGGEADGYNTGSSNKDVGEEDELISPKTRTLKNGLFSKSVRALVGKKDDTINKDNDLAPADEPYYVIKDIKTGKEVKVQGAMYGDETVMTKVDDEFPIAPPEPELVTSNSDEMDQKSEYLNISRDGELVKYAAPTKTTSNKSQFNYTYHSYHDVHKDLFKDTKTKLDDYSNIVSYVDDWKSIVDKCVSTKYEEYTKCRSALVHYEKKLASLQVDINKLQSKGKEIPQKMSEKMERNGVKLDGTRKTHDKCGESLLMLLDEVVLRAWRDALPLLRKSIKSEVAFAAVAQEHVDKLGAPLKLLEIIGSRESVTTEGRLTAYENSNIEDYYTGKRNFTSTAMGDV